MVSTFAHTLETVNRSSRRSICPVGSANTRMQELNLNIREYACLTLLKRSIMVAPDRLRVAHHRVQVNHVR